MTDDGGLPASAARVQAVLRDTGFANQVTVFAETTRTSREAAEAIGTTVAQIAKSLIFKGKTSGAPVLVIASGVNRVDEKAVRDVIGEKIGRADPDFVRQHTSYVIGGVPPIGHAAAGHATAPICVIDADLLAFAHIWAAAGAPNAVFRLTPDELVQMTGGRVARVAKVG